MKCLLGWVLGLGVVLHAGAAGFTDEQWSLVSRVLGSAHLAVSADEQWRLRVQGTQLVREPNRPGAPAAALDVGDTVRAMAASGDARRAVVQVSNWCIGVARFEAGAPAQLTWPAAALATQGEPKGACPATRQPVSRLSFAVAMSPDGRRIAVPVEDELRLIDINQDRVLQRWPLGSATVLQLAFLDEGRQLIVRAAVLGEVYEGPGRPSNLVLARWDTASGALLDLMRQPDADRLGALQLLSAMSVDKGWLWELGAGEADDKGSRSVKALARSLHECGWPQKTATTLQLPKQPLGSLWLDLAADPAGRWLAVSEYEPGSFANWWIWSTADGRRLGGESRRGASEAPWRALQPSADGSRLRGVMAGLPEAGRIDAEMWTAFHGGGAWVERAVAGLPAAPAAAARPRGGACLVASEGERSAGVREVRDGAKPPQRLFELSLEQPGVVDAQRERADRCVAENGWGARAPSRWGLGADGALWLDAGAQLRRIDPSDGRILAQLPTPRSAQVCSAAIFSARQFLNWQGDTVTLRPFEAASGEAGRRVVARRPGWVADAAIWLESGRISVRWKNPKAEIEAPGGAQGQLYVEQGGRFVPDGQVAPGMVVGGGHVYLNGEDEGEEPMPASSDWLVSPQPPRYRWQAGPFGSLQSRQVQTDELALWLGMKAGASGDTSTAFSLGGNLGLANIDGGHVVFDAAKRERRLLLPGGWMRAAHLPVPGVLLVEWEDRLTAYRLAP